MLLTRSLTAVPGLEAATLLLLEPVFNPIWTWVIHGERASVQRGVGQGSLIITAAFAGPCGGSNLHRFHTLRTLLRRIDSTIV